MVAGGLVDGNTAILSVSTDGGVDWPRSLRFAASLYADGVRAIVVTSRPECFDVMQRRVPQFTAQLSQHGVFLRVAMAVELTLQNDLFEWTDRLAHSAIGPAKRYVYLRVASDNVMPVEMVIGRLVEKNLVPILLAPERCQQFREQPRRLAELIKRGALVQLSAASLCDASDSDRVRFCRRLIRKGDCHMVASESGRHHDLPISLCEAYELVASWTGLESADRLCKEHPSAILKGHALSERPRQSIWSFRRAA